MCVRRQQQVIAALTSEPGFQLSCIDYLLGHTAVAEAAASHHGDNSFSFVACKLFCLYDRPILSSYSFFDVWVSGPRIDPLRLLAQCHRSQLTQASLNLCSLIWLLMMVWSKRGNINTAALVTIAHCNTLVARCSRQRIGPANWVFVKLGPLRCA